MKLYDIRIKGILKKLGVDRCERCGKKTSNLFLKFFIYKWFVLCKECYDFVNQIEKKTFEELGIKELWVSYESGRAKRLHVKGKGYEISVDLDKKKLE